MHVDSGLFYPDLSRNSFWNDLTQEERDELVAQDELEVAEARTNVEMFFEYVMKEQLTKVPLKVMPHQRVGLSFMMDHERSVHRWPVGCSKTHCIATLTLFLMGQDVTLRGAIISATQAQAAKVLAVVRDYIETSIELQRVFPHLRKSQRDSDPWTQTCITVDRPPGIPDASLYAVGIDGGLPGARLNWIIVDDILNRENTSTKQARDKVYEFFDSSVLSRLDPVGTKVVVLNSAWHPDDLTHRLEKLGWATLHMDILGNVQIQDDVVYIEEGKSPWSHRELRPATNSKSECNYRLRSHDPDPTNSIPLWPERYSLHYIDTRLRSRHLPAEFNRAYMNICRDDKSSMCSIDFIEKCKKLARDEKFFAPTAQYRGNNPTFTGVDLAISPGEENDDTAFVTIEVRKDGTIVLLEVEVGQWDGPTIVDKLFQKHAQFKSTIRIENNAAQDYIRQFALKKRVSLPIKAHTTGRTKAHPEYGVPSIFLDLHNGVWRIPNNKHGECTQQIQKFVDGCLYYAPSKHTDDALMAAYFAREQAKAWGVLVPPPEDRPDNFSISASVMAR